MCACTATTTTTTTIVMWTTVAYCHCRLFIAYRINIMDNIMNMMEKYAYNLEEIVEERTQQLVEEKKKTDRLLYRMLPSYVSHFLLQII